SPLLPDEPLTSDELLLLDPSAWITLVTSPVLSFRMTAGACPNFWLKANALSRLPAAESAEPLPIRPRPQLSSMNRGIDAWSVNVLSTKFCFAHGEMTSSGWRGPTPQRSFCAGGVAPGPPLPGPFRASDGPWDWRMIGPIWWSYQPSESS